MAHERQRRAGLRLARHLLLVSLGTACGGRVIHSDTSNTSSSEGSLSNSSGGGPSTGSSGSGSSGNGSSGNGPLSIGSLSSGSLSISAVGNSSGGASSMGTLITSTTGNAAGSGGMPNWTNGIAPLSTKGRDFVDPFGNVVVLRGVAIADIMEVDTERAGMTVSGLIRYLTDASAGFYARVLRFTVFPERWLVDPEQYLAEHLRPAVDQAAELGLYVIIDWHEISDVEPVAERTATFWNRVAPEFAEYSNVLYEIFNEPMNIENPSWQNWKQAAQPWVDSIREQAPDNIILIGGPYWSQQIGGAATDPFEGSNLAYVGHIYPIIDPYTWSDMGVMAQVAAVQPLMITEWGFRNDGELIWNATVSSFGEPLRAFIENHRLSWTAWCADNLWGPVMFDPDWLLLGGEGEMGGFVKDWLAETKDSDQPGG